VNRPGHLPHVTRAVNLDARAVRLLRLVLLATVAAPFVLLYAFSSGFRSEVHQALGLLGRGDVAGLRDYILSFGL
jgi:hypothetical protein